MKDFTLIVIGDGGDFDAFKKFHKEKRRLARFLAAYRVLSYEELLSNTVPRVKSDNIIVFLFFPFTYWNKNIETGRYKGVYANRSFYVKFRNFFKEVDKALRRKFPDKKIYFVNSPVVSARARDKLRVKKLLLAAGIRVPKTVRVKGAPGVNRYTSRGKGLFIKPRYGSMGKGITYAGPKIVKTNFIFRSGRILSRKSDYGWNFKNISRVNVFLKKLLAEDMYVEEELDTRLVRGRKFDLRVYVFFGDVLYIYPKSNDPVNITTNISQEGRGERPSFLRLLPKALILRVKKAAIRASGVIGAGFAGVDVMVGRGIRDVYVVDVNVFPGFPKRKMYNLSAHMARALSSGSALKYFK